MLTVPSVVRTPTLPVSIVPTLHQPRRSSGNTIAVLTTSLAYPSMARTPFFFFATRAPEDRISPRERRGTLLQRAHDERGAGCEQHHSDRAQQRLARDSE